MAKAIDSTDSADDVVLLRTQVTYEAEMLGGPGNAYPLGARFGIKPGDGASADRGTG